MHQNFVYLFLCVIVSVAFADNPICDNTEEYQIYNTRCFSFGDEFVFVSKNWPEYDNGEEKPDEDNGYMDLSYYGTFGIFYSECEYQESELAKVLFA